MGLHLCYRLTLPGSLTVDSVRQKLGALKAFAETLDFENVLGPTEYTADELADWSDREIVKVVASTFCGEPPDFYGLRPGDSAAVAFLVLPGKECEPALFGFVAPGSRADQRDPGDDLHPGDWFWTSACKTQYASIISDEHLVKCHTELVRLLEHASTLGIEVQVEDETGFWEHRSAELLIKSVRDMNRLIARLAGAIHDRNHDVKAPIFDHPDFERLETENLELRSQADGSDEFE